MSIRTKILVVHHDLDVLSRIYLSLVHRNYKAEATDNWEEVPERLKRFRPSLVIIGIEEFILLQKHVKVPGIVLLRKGDQQDISLPDDFIGIENPVTDVLIHAIESLVI
ncbi:MAG TPA: hypothetical protein VM012_12185 [Flavitalea sp.]|nr:hypothetical protein [Flavitalea sp.]